MASIASVRNQLIEKFKDASYWQRHYEVTFQQTGSRNAQRNAMYYEGLRRGFEVALAEMDALAS